MSGRSFLDNLVISGVDKKVRSAFLHVGLIVSCCTYILVGAYVFQAIERPHEVRRSQEARRIYTEMQRDLISNLTEYPDNFDKLIDEYTKEMFQMFEDPIAAHVFEVYFTSNEVERDLWTFPNSILFTSTTVIPVGYGYICPVTSLGKILVIVYGVFGIPLALVTMADAGKFISMVVTGWFNDSLTIPTVLFLSVLTIYPVVGGLVFNWMTGMDFYDAVYFSLISIFTIGFGDLTPSVPLMHLIFFIVIGVILVTITIDFVAAEVINRIHYMGRHVGKARELASRMFQIAQSLGVNKGISVGMTQLHALAKFGMMGKMDQRGSTFSQQPKMRIAFEPMIDDIEFVDKTVRASKLGLYNL